MNAALQQLSQLRQLATDPVQLNRDQGRLVQLLDALHQALPGVFLDRWKPATTTITATTTRPTLQFESLSRVDARTGDLVLYLPPALPLDAGRRVSFLKKSAHGSVTVVPAASGTVAGNVRYQTRDAGLHELWWDGNTWAPAAPRQPHWDVRDFGAVGDGVIDDTEAVRDALLTAALVGARVVFPPGTYMIADKIEIPDGADFEAELMLGAEINFTRATGIPAREACITIGTDTAGLTNLPGLGANLALHASSVTFASAHGLAAGDLFILWDDNDTSWHDASVLLDSRPYYKRGEWFRVRSVTSSTVVTVDTESHDLYVAAANIKLVKVTQSRFNIFGKGKIRGASTALLDVGIQTWNCYRSTIRDIEIEGCLYCSINLWRSYECDIIDVKTNTRNAVGNEGASVFFIGNYDCWVRGGSHRAGKHAFSITGGAIASPVPSRYCGAENATLRADLTAADMHGHCEDCAFKNCEIDGGCALGGFHATLSGGSVRSVGDFFAVGVLKGMCIRLREVKGGDFTIEDVEVRSNHASAQSSGDFPVALDTTEAIQRGRVVVNNLRIRASMPSGGTQNAKVVYCMVAPASGGDIEFSINGIEYEGIAGQKAPTLILECTDSMSGDGAFRQVTVMNTKGLSIQTSNCRAKQLTIQDCDVSTGITHGIVAALVSYSGVTQLIDIIDCKLRDNDEAGIFVSGTAAANDTHVMIKGCRSINNGQDTGAAASSRVSLRAENLKSLEIRNNTWGDTQGSATQQALISLNTVTTVRGGGNGAIGSMQYGSASGNRSITSVTNDLEDIELEGSGSPEGAVYGWVGTRYRRSDGTQYIKVSGVGTNTGWNQLAPINAAGVLLTNFLLQAGGGYTIASGAITVTTGWAIVETEGAAASDDLDTINGGGGFPGGHLVLQAVNSGRTVVVKHNTGNILLDGVADFSLDNVADKLVLFYDSVNSKWCEISRSSNGA